MNFDLNQEQQMLADMVDRLFTNEHDWQVRRYAVSNPDYMPPSLWDKLAEIGLLGIYVNESGEDDPQEIQDRAVAAHLIGYAMGKVLALEPFVSTAVMAAQLLSGPAGSAGREQIIESLVLGKRKIAIATLESGADYRLEHVQLTAKRSEQGFRLNGRKVAVIDGPVSDNLIVSCRTSGEATSTRGITLFLVASDTSGVRFTSSRALDGTPVSDIDFDDVEVTSSAIVGIENEGFAQLEYAVQRGISALLSEAVGVMDGLFKMTVEYLNTRKQFGEPLSHFQALQHHIADIYTHIEQARSMTMVAIGAAVHADARERRKLVAAAKCKVGEAARLVGEMAVQLHGGIGMSDELAVGHYFRRLLSIDSAWGNSAHYGRLYTDLMVGAESSSSI